VVGLPGFAAYVSYRWLRPGATAPSAELVTRAFQAGALASAVWVAGAVLFAVTSIATDTEDW